MLEVQIRTQRLREERNFSQSELATRAGVRRDTVSALERGKSQGIQFETLARLCAALACEPGDLLILTEVEPPLVLGGQDEDDLVRERLANPGKRIDGPTFLQALLDEEAHAARP